jgi:hypothetical protein
MEETNGPEKIKAEAKEGIEGMKENASAAIDATRHAAEAAWSKANSLQSTCTSPKKTDTEIWLTVTVCGLIRTLHFVQGRNPA